MNLEGVREKPWMYSVDGSSPMQGPKSELDDAACFTISTRTENLTSNRDATDMGLLVLVAVGSNPLLTIYNVSSNSQNVDSQRAIS